jgi:pimeloyl-ACP methyl ester carboxylesterase
VVGRKFAAILFCLFLLPLSTAQVAAQTAAPVEARNVVFVHGAWADGSSWSEVIPLLQAAGLRVTSVQNPLTSLADAAAETRRALALQDGPTVLAGHSWSGTLVSEVGRTRRSRRSFTSRREPRMRVRTLSLSLRNFPPRRRAQASRTTAASLGSPRMRFSSISPMALRARRRKFSTPCSSRLPPRCSAIERRLRPGGRSQTFMQCRRTTGR